MLVKDVLQPIVERISVSPGQAVEILDGIGNAKADNSTVTNALENARNVVSDNWNSAPRDTKLNRAYDDFLSEIDVAIFEIEKNKNDPDAWRKISFISDD